MRYVALVLLHRRSPGGGSWLLLLGLLLASSCKDPNPATASARPSRIVTTTPSLTELTAAVAGVETLVGVDEFSTLPEGVAALPKVGSFLDANLEVILALRPDLVVLSDVQAPVAGPLDDAGIATLVLPMHTLADVHEALTALGSATQRPERAAAVSARLEATLRRFRQRPPPRQRPKVLVVLDREVGGLGSMIAAGTGTYLDQLLALLGAENAIAAAGVHYPKLGPEEILRAAPTVILDASQQHSSEGDNLAPWHELRGVPAVDARKIYPIDALYLSPNLRIAEALAGLEQMLYGTTQR